MRGDAAVNKDKCHILDQVERVNKRMKWCDIRMGDILEVKKDEVFPTDMLLLFAQNEKDEPVDIIFVDTMNLDGETNLKPRTIAHSAIDSTEKLMTCSAMLEYDRPSENLDKWDGILTYEGVTKASGIDNLLLRGCKLKNTKVAYGVVIYVGKQTKVMMNAKKPPVKVSRMMKLMNYFLYSIFAV